MVISKNNKCNKNKAGFTLVELVVVLAGLAALSAITVPGILSQIKLSKIEATKALMNGYAADCLGKYRTSIKPSIDYVDKVEPSFDTDQLENLGYNIVIYPVTTQRLAMRSVEDGLRSIFKDGHQNNIIDKMQTRKRLYELVEYEKYNTPDKKITDFKTEGHE